MQGRLLGSRQGTDTDDSAELDEEIEKLKDAHLPDQPVIIHPYFGYVVNPEAQGINQYGFFQDPPLTDKSSDAIVIAIFGGSVADQVFYMSQDTLVAELQRHAPFHGKQIDVVSTALGGYKQPQQLLILNYMLARGARYDVVIDIDGFNEIDGPMENILDGVNPFFPYHWKLHARQGLDIEAMTHLGKVEIIRERQRRLRNFFARRPFRDSVFFLTLWDILDQRQWAALRGEMKDLSALLDDDILPPRVRGPRVDFPSPHAMYEDLADVWQRSSQQMAAVCKANGIRYFHFLQPNQYVPDSKPLTAEELDVAYDPEWTGVERVPEGYPLLAERGKALREAGVSFFDLTMLFENEPRTVYSDFCCHFNQLGTDLIATEIARDIAGEMGEKPAAPGSQAG